MKTKISLIAKVLKIGVWIVFTFLTFQYSDLMFSYIHSSTSLEATNTEINLFIFVVVSRFFIAYAITQVIQLLSEGIILLSDCIISILENRKKAKKQ